MASRFWKYGLSWPKTIEEICIEMDMCREGGRWQGKNGMKGEGMFFHFKRYLSLLWPEIVWHKWADLQLKCFLNHRIIGQIGAASTGKTFVPSACMLADYYLFPDSTTVLVSSTTRESLEMRVLGEVKKLHRIAKQRYNWIPGNLIEGRQRIVTDDRSIAAEGRDFRNGLVGVACKRGQAFQGIEEYVGIKNKRLRLLADELQFLPRIFVDSIANLNKNTDFKCVGSGNPKDTTDALGVLCEPAAHLGGWNAGLDQMPGAKTWEIRFKNGICIQLPGSDSPNLDGKLGIPLITQEQIDADIAFYGQDSIQYTMMDEGRMPRGQSLKRVINRQMCLKYHAMEEPVWGSGSRTMVAGLDTAYRGVGGDRSVLTILEFGPEADSPDAQELATAIISQIARPNRQRQIISLVDSAVVPVVDKIGDTPEDQIVHFVMEQCSARGIPPENLYFDSTGRGSLATRFAALWSASINPIEFGGTPTERSVSHDIDIMAKDYYFNFVTELWYSMQYVILAGQFRNLTEDVMNEGCFREWGHQGKRIKVEPKEAMKLKSGRSPDLFDSLVCALEGARRRGFVIMRSPSKEVKRDKPTWKRDIRERSNTFWRSNELTYT